MRRFHFRLAPILSLRRHREDSARLELGRISGICAALRQQIAAREAERRAALTQVARPDRIDVLYRYHNEQYAVRLAAEIARLQETLTEREKERAAAVEIYRKAKQDADVLQRLHDARERQHYRAEMSAEQHRLDEVSRHVYLRQTKEKGEAHA